VNVRIDTQPPGYGSEPHLDFIVTDLDGMLPDSAAQTGK